VRFGFIRIFAPSYKKFVGYIKIILINIGMYLDSTKKKEIFSKFGGSEANTGSVEGQVALFSFRISHLTEHLKKNRKDYGTQRALQLLVGKRRSLLDYLKRNDIEKYRALIKELGLRR
jgi:small subunit ribosomal protein S15